MTILGIDCNYICHRSRHIFGDMEYDGRPTGVIYGFLLSILQLGLRFSTNKFCFCWDSKHSKRKEMFPSYKQHRREFLTEEEREILRKDFMQFDLLRKKILPYIGFRNVFMVDGFESDDLLARLADILVRKYNHNKRNFIIVTSDDDLLQCLHSHVYIYNPSKKKVMSKHVLREEKGVSPKGWRNVKILAGCKGDNIPGVKGVGEVTAIKFLKKELPDGKKKASIEQFIKSEDFQRNMKLVTLPFPETPYPPRSKDNLDIEKFSRVCQKFGFKSFLESSGNNGWEVWQAFFEGFESELTLVHSHKAKGLKRV